MKNAYLKSGGLALLVFLSLGVGGGATSVLAGADTKPVPVSPQLMNGEVVMLSGEVCVVRDATGRSVLFKVDKGTKINGSVKEGKKVEVSASADGQVLSIKEAS